MKNPAPSIAQFLLGLCLPASVREDVLGDLAESYTKMGSHASGFRRRLWYWKHAFALGMAYLFRGSTGRSAQDSGGNSTLGIAQDVAYSIRLLRRNSVFTLAALGTLALGIAANVTIFSFVNGLLIRALPYPESERLVRVYALRNGERAALSVPELDALNQSGIFASAGAFFSSRYNFSGHGTPEQIFTTIATRSLFDTLRVQPSVGTVWPEYNDRQRSFMVMLTHEFWERKFQSDPEIAGKQLYMDAAPYTIAGVLPQGFRFPGEVSVFRCFGVFPQYFIRDNRLASTVARLRPGATLEQASRDLAAFAQQQARDFPTTNANVTFILEPLRDSYVGKLRPYLLLLLGGVGFVLLIACSNLVNLLLSRSVARQKEFAIRTSLGADRWRLIRQMVIETLVLTTLGGGIGVAMAIWWSKVLARMIRDQLPPWAEVSLDTGVIGFAAVVILLCGLLTGVSPALRMSGDVQHRLRDGARGTEGMDKTKLRNILVVAEVALAAVLLVGAGILVQSFLRLQAGNVGFRTGNLLTFRVNLPWKTYNPPRVRLFQAQLLEKLSQIPGVAGAAFNNAMPLTDRDDPAENVLVEGQDPKTHSNPTVRQQNVSHNYHALMGIPLIAGRFFTDDDRPNTQPVTLVSQSMARRLWPVENPLGRRIKLDPQFNDSIWRTVVGVVGDVRRSVASAEPSLDAYVSAIQTPASGMYEVRTFGEPNAIVDAAIHAVGQLDPDQSVHDISAMDRRIVRAVWQQQVSGTLFSLFGVVALALAAVGLYGVLSYSVSQRTRELGIRVALGADRMSVLRLVMAQALGLTATGLLIGLAAGYAMARAMSSWLREVSAADPLTFAGVASLLIAVGAMACYLPARRAVSIDPMTALRSD